MSHHPDQQTNVVSNEVAVKLLVPAANGKQQASSKFHENQEKGNSVTEPMQWRWIANGHVVQFTWRWQYPDRG